MNEKIKEKISEIFCANEKNTSRIKKDESLEIRTEFDRDKDRILYSRAFRRLSGKTQIFLSGKDDHIRNRLSHTLEVAQIARTISKYLGLNENLTEAIALGHDIGHTPFGHVGERTLNDIMSGCDELKDFKECLTDEDKGFKHNLQSIRVVTDLESCNKLEEGLNLTKYTLWGIVNHSSLKYKLCKHYNNGNCTLRRNEKKCNNKERIYSLKFYDKYNNILKNENVTIEGLIVGIADEIAQRHHDVDDALVVGIIDINELIDKIVTCYGDFFDNDKKDEGKINEIRNEKDVDLKRIMLGSSIVNILTREVTYNLENKLMSYISLFNFQSADDFEKKKSNDNFIETLKKDINFEEKLLKNDKDFQSYIKHRILNSYKAQLMDGKGNFIIRELFKAYITNPQQLPDKTIKRLFKNLNEKKVYMTIENEKVGELRNKLQDLHSKDCKEYKAVLMRTICDYISGMTDKFALEVHSELYLS